jgi:general secretion pathway protein E
MINIAYQQRSGEAQTLIESLDRSEVLSDLQSLVGREDLLDVAGRAPVIRLVNLMLFEAVKGGASDVHIQPYEERLVVRFRIDGVLFDAFAVPKPLQEEVVSRIKVVGKMNIAEKRLPQDGRATVQVGDRRIDLRIASLPGSHGERVVLRLLDKSARLYTLPEVGMDDQVLVQFRDIIRMEHGLILVTGPTGSGKSTTLYAALQEINSRDRNVVTLEDPIEYQIDGISQTQINTKKGLTFAAGLRSVLRQDPDIIMVGEIRDEETAVMAIQSALTGHLVFSTLHTNDAASAVTRLLDLGIEPYLISSSLLAVLAQRLVRKICSECCQEYPTSNQDVEFLKQGNDRCAAEKLKRGRGCPNCRETGYRGRLGLFELLTIDEHVRAKIQQRANASEIRDKGLARDMQLLRDDGVAKILRGLTTVEEVSRVTVRAVI